MELKFNKVYCLTIDKNEERRKNILKIFNDYYHIDFEFFYAFPFYKSIYSDLFKYNPKVIPFGNYNWDNSVYIDYDDGRSLSIYIANYLIVYNALMKGINNVLIIEDDVCLYKDLKLIERYFNEIPEDADIVRYGYNIGFDENDVDQIKLDNKDKLFFKDNKNLQDKMGAQMFALMNKKTMEIYCENIAKTLTGGDNPYNTFINNEYNLNVYFSLTNLALDHITYEHILNNKIPPMGYRPFDIKSIKKNINNYFKNE